MKFRHKIETININGLKEFSVNYFLTDELIVGRGSGCLIRLTNRLVELSHTKVRANSENQLVVEDMNTDGGTRVNDVLIKKPTVVKEGDRIKVGDVTFTVFNDGTYWGFHEVREEKLEEDRDAIVSRWTKRLDLNRLYPSFTSFSLLLVASIGLIAFVEPYVGMNQGLWSSGPISNPHKMIEKNCAACHTNEFTPVIDAQCQQCHRLSEHSPAMSHVTEKHPDMNFRCADCHHEHNGDQGIIESKSELCTQCHGNLEKFFPLTKHPQVKSFNRHPEFAVSIPQYDENGAETFSKRVSFDDKDELLDSTRLKLNHAKHLVKDLNSPTGPQTLKCQDCHKHSDDLHNIVPITFEANCKSCHPIGFDERLSDRQVPHGEPDVVYAYLIAEYAKLFLNTERQNTRQDFVRRFRPGQTAESETPSIDFTKQFVEQESRKAETELFTKTACFLCHQVRPADNTGPGKSKFRVLKPNLPSVWMPETIFSHGAHQEVECESCHRGVRKSTETTDVLLPKLADCSVCHAQAGHEGKVGSECITCHSFHRPLLLSDRSRRAIREIISRSDM